MKAEKKLAKKENKVYNKTKSKNQAVDIKKFVIHNRQRVWSL